MRSAHILAMAALTASASAAPPLPTVAYPTSPAPSAGLISSASPSAGPADKDLAVEAALKAIASLAATNGHAPGSTALDDAFRGIYNLWSRDSSAVDEESHDIDGKNVEGAEKEKRGPGEGPCQNQSVIELACITYAYCMHICRDVMVTNWPEYTCRPWPCHMDEQPDRNDNI
ncbi:hypothetical protein MBLNU459_g0575t1 [Dothideomycetes sp. NU459]